MIQNKKSISSVHYIFASVIFTFSYVLINQWNKYTPIQCSVSFTPYDNCTQKIIDEINKANDEILVQTYSFTSKPIIEALINQHKNGKKVIIIADNSQKNSTIFVKLKNYGIPIYIDKLPGIAHNKVMIIDNQIVLTGSFNFTESAQYRNAENSLIILSKTIASKYKNNFERRLKVSTEYNNLHKLIYCSDNTVIKKINNAKKIISIQTDLFLNDKIIDALIKQHNKKINIIIVTNQNADNNKINKLKELNIPIHIDNKITSNYSTFIFIDKDIMITNNKELTNDQFICTQSKELINKYKKQINIKKQFTK